MKEISRLLRAAGFAFEGLFWLIKEQKNTRILLFCAALTLIICPLINFTALQTAFVFFIVMVTVIAEVLNTAIEITLDLIVEGKIHPKVKIAKDISACTVLFGVITSITVTLVFLYSNLKVH